LTSHLSVDRAVGYGDNTVLPAGTTQATATTLPADHNFCPTVPASSGVILKSANAGALFTVGNGDAANTLCIYPPVGASINGSAANTPLCLPKQRAAYFVYVNATTINGIY
jgi:hypothetical protein